MNHEDDMEYIGSIAFLKELKAGKESTFDFLFRNRYEPLCRLYFGGRYCTGIIF